MRFWMWLLCWWRGTKRTGTDSNRQRVAYEADAGSDAYDKARWSRDAYNRLRPPLETRRICR